jgi:hypothetical protein
LEQCNAYEHQRSSGKGPQGFTGQGRIDKHAHDLRGIDAQADARQQQNAEQNEAAPLRADVL